MGFRPVVQFRIALLASTIALAVYSNCAEAQAYDFRIVHRFGGLGDGSDPDGPVQFDAAGNLYGVTKSDNGAIFRIAKDGTESILYSFRDNRTAGGPADIAVDPATGDVYGAAAFGGDMSACSGYGCGLIYKVTAGGTYTVLHRFDDLEGQRPGGLIRDDEGNLYGTTWEGGTYGLGTIFKYGMDGSFTVLHAFEGSPNSRWSNSDVIRDRAGNLYGTTEGGGTAGYGSVFKLAPDGAFTTLYDFTGGMDGKSPAYGVVRDESGNLYGAALGGGTHGWGTVFKLTADGTLTTLYNFMDKADGGTPKSVVLVNGNLYGTTFEGGYPDCNLGTCPVIFRIAADGAYTVLRSFTWRDGCIAPGAGLTLKYGRLFGTTARNGESFGSCDADTVYSVGITQP